MQHASHRRRAERRIVWFRAAIWFFVSRYSEPAMN
jgi:hypothetical protein